MSSKNQTRSLHGNKTKSHFDLSRHYREIGIKAVAAAHGAHLAEMRKNNREKENGTEEKKDEWRYSQQSSPRNAGKL